MTTTLDDESRDDESSQEGLRTGFSVPVLAAEMRRIHARRVSDKRVLKNGRKGA